MGLVTRDLFDCNATSEPRTPLTMCMPLNVHALVSRARRLERLGLHADAFAEQQLRRINAIGKQQLRRTRLGCRPRNEEAAPGARSKRK